MKKILSLTLIFVLCLSLCACSTRNRADINYYLERLSDSSPFASDTRNEYSGYYQEYSDDKYFKEAILAKLAEYGTLEDPSGENPANASNKAIRLVGALNALGYDDADITNAFQQLIIKELDEYAAVGDFESISRTICLLEDFSVHNEAIKSQFQNILTNLQNEVFSGNGALSMHEYFENVNRILLNGRFSKTLSTENDCYYTSLLECYPYDEMTSFIVANGEPVIATFGNGGYYDNLTGDYKDESYWYDPLSETKISEGEVGTYKYEKEYQFKGDFLLAITTKKWYMVDSSDPNNTVDANLWYKGERVIEESDYVSSFLMTATDSNCFYFDNVFYVLEKNVIRVFDRDLYTITYEGDRPQPPEVNYKQLLQLLESSNYTNNVLIHRISQELGDYKDTVSILQSFEYVKQSSASNDALVYNSTDCYEGTSFPTMEFYLGKQIEVSTEQFEFGMKYRYANVDVMGNDYLDSDGFLFRYGFECKTIHDSGLIYYYIFFDDMGNALRKRIVSDASGWYTEVLVIYPENVQSYFEWNDWPLD